MTVYDDELPIPREWAEKHQGETITVRYVMSLWDLIDVNGIEGMNDYLDDVAGVILSDIDYVVGEPGPDDDLGNNSLLIEATGDVEVF